MGILNHPLWLSLFLIFSIHQVLQKIVGLRFWWADNYLDSLLCMPIFLGFILAERRFILKNRKNYSDNNNIYTFSFFEIFVMILTLGIIFEECFPRWSNQFTRDHWDYLNYFLGGIFFHYFFNIKTTKNRIA